MAPPLLHHAVYGLVVAAKPVAPDVLPTPGELDTQLTNTPAAWSTLLIRVLDAHVDPLFNSLPATPVVGATGGGAVAWNTAARIRKVMSDPASVPFVPPPTNTLPLSKADVLDFKLRSFQRTGDVLAALDIYVTYIASGRLLAPALTASKNAAKGAVRDLVALEAFLVRYSASVNAAARVGMTLAETLALYRVEGDLVAPMSGAHFADRLPVNEKLDVRNLGLDTGNVNLTLQRGLWSYPFKALALRALSIPAAALPAVGAARAAAEERVKCFALIHWMLAIGGVDVAARTISLPIDSIAFRHGIAKFGHDYSTALGIPSTLAAWEAELVAVIADLKCTWPGDENGRVIVAPDTPVFLASFAMTVAMLIFRRDHAHGGGPFIPPPPGLEYLGYHVQADRVAKTDDRFVYVIASAAVAAAKSGNPAFAPLKTKLAPFGLPSKLSKDPSLDSSDHVAVFDKLTTGVGSFFSDLANTGLLADFILRAEHADWTAFEENRGNLARYRKLLAYYTALLN